ncbi:DNA-processing protein DprA [Vallicoccus soli]|uniref:DNA-protecting protein DprA n=1 Tax=Vallicoccus soli TaxID=2339232 RepID=A0A3A3Z983_9ACTN|nr:DNA-processing protein DprA [Vallicoccus soli]RJK98477.1 DNA-protecting protein DprA [Vallicoccus soli]
MSAGTGARAARAALAAVSEPGDALVHDAVALHGPEEVLSRLRAGDGTVLPGRASARRLEGYGHRLAALDEAAAAPDGAGSAGGGAGAADGDPARALRLVCPGDEEWPSQLDDLALAGASGGFPLRPPLCLWVRGAADLRALAARSVAVIGARAATAYGEHVAADLAAEVAERGWTVLSGAAYGVDAAAHRGAVAGGGSTVAVLACGADAVYPRGHELLLHRVAQSGAVVSELPPGATVTRSRLLQRNRLVAALTRGTVVVEAAVRSGTASTAGHAAALGRTVMAVPGPVTAPTSAGCHALVRAGRAVLVTSGAEVVDAVGRLGDDAAPAPRGEERPEDGLTPVQLRVLDALPVRRGAPVARLAREAGLDLGSVRAALGLLVLEGLAEADEHGHRVSAALRARRRPERA